MIKSLGIRAHDYGKMTSKDLSQAVRRDGLGSVQLAVAKAIEGIDDIADILSDHRVKAIGKDFAEAEVAIAVLGCYLNYAHPDKDIRRKNLDVFKAHIAYAPHLKARVVGTETGSLLPDYSYTPENHTEASYKIFADSLYELLDVAEQTKVNLAVEGVWDHIICSNERMDRLIKDMKSDRLKVILDPVNLLNVNNYKNHDDIVRQSFDLFGDRIQIIHAKDYRVEGKDILEISHGTGIYEYGFLTEMIEEAPEPIDILLENADVSNLVNIKALFGR